MNALVLESVRGCRRRWVTSGESLYGLEVAAYAIIRQRTELLDPCNIRESSTQPFDHGGIFLGEGPIFSLL
jgi:hypothetical protein